MLTTSWDLEILHFDSLFGICSIYDVEDAEKNKEEKVVLCVYEITQYIITHLAFFMKARGLPQVSSSGCHYPP